MISAVNHSAQFPEPEILVRYRRRKRKLKREDKRKVVIALLLDARCAAFSDGFIAAKARVSQPFVSTVRRELSQNVLSVRATKRRGADGVVRNVKHIGKTPKRNEREFVLNAIHQGAWTIKELIDDTGLTRIRLQAILDELYQHHIITNATRRSGSGGRPEILWIPNPNHVGQK